MLRSFQGKQHDHRPNSCRYSTENPYLRARLHGWNWAYFRFLSFRDCENELVRINQAAIWQLSSLFRMGSAYTKYVALGSHFDIARECFNLVLRARLMIEALDMSQGHSDLEYLVAWRDNSSFMKCYWSTNSSRHWRSCSFLGSKSRKWVESVANM